MPRRQESLHNIRHVHEQPLHLFSDGDLGFYRSLQLGTVTGAIPPQEDLMPPSRPDGRTFSLPRCLK